MRGDRYERNKRRGAVAENLSAAAPFQTKQVSVLSDIFPSLTAQGESQNKYKSGCHSAHSPAERLKNYKSIKSTKQMFVKYLTSGIRCGNIKAQQKSLWLNITVEKTADRGRGTASNRNVRRE